MAKIENSKDLILHLLYVPGQTGKVCEPITGKTRLQKMLFLFKEEVWKKFKLDKHIDNKALPSFEAYDFGPFSKQIYEDIEFLSSVGFVSKSGDEDDESIEQELRDEFKEVNEDYEEETYSLSNVGKEFIESGEAGTLSKNQQEILQEFKTRSCQIPLRALLLYVYSNYPAMTTNSKIKDKVLKGVKA